MTDALLADNKEVAEPLNTLEIDSEEQKKIMIEAIKSVDPKSISYGTGRKKDAISRVWIKAGTGKIVVRLTQNGKKSKTKDIDTYFTRASLSRIVTKAFRITNSDEKFDVLCTVSGGGLSGQAGALANGIGVALSDLVPSLKVTIKKAGLISKKSRVVERKTPGSKKARKGATYSKR